MAVQVYKFGGASVRNAEMIDNVTSIINDFKGEKLVVVISAMGKTTNKLEEIIKAYFYKQGNAGKLLEELKQDHYETVKQLGIATDDVLMDINDTFVEIDWVIEDEVKETYGYYYDQVVSVGELLSTKIVSHYAQSKGVNCTWLDVRDVFLTDNVHTEAKIDWKVTEERVKQKTQDIFQKNDIIITQGFIGSTSENFTTTLGREGSDYSAAIFAYCTDGEALTIWKDVPGILTGDPRIFDNVAKIDKLDYREAIEMTYFGAKVIHPKTIKPLQNKRIPLFVKPFNDRSGEGTMISDQLLTSAYPPVVVIEQNQSLLHFSTKDFSFVAEEHLGKIFSQLDEHLIKVNMMRNSAISFSVSVTNDDTKIKKLQDALQDEFNIEIDRGLQLITIRHYDKQTIKRLIEDKTVIFEEKIGDTARFVVKEIPKMVFR